MIKIKNYCVLLALVSSAFLCGMELRRAGAELNGGALGQEDPVKHICDKIDKDILGVDPDSWCKRITGSYASVCKSYSFAGKPHEVIEQLSKIENYIPSLWHDHGTFQRLQSSHWLVHYLLYELMQDKVRQLNDVKGSTIDDLLNVNKQIYGLSLRMSSFINRSALQSYEKARLLDQPIEKFYFGNEDEEIHYTHLNTWGAGEVCTLVVPKDGTCVKGVTSNGRSIIWNIKDGKEINEFMTVLSDAQQQCFKDGYIVKSDYLAVLGNAGLSGISSVVHPVLASNKMAAANRMWKRSEIFLFEKPTLASRLCQKALWNCNRNSDIKELTTLKNSLAAQNLKGFVQHNLFTKIDTGIKAIAVVHQALEGI